MGLKGSGPFFQRSMANSVLAGYVTRICEIYIDDVLIHGPTDNEYLGNTRKVLGRLREKKVTANPAKTRLGLKEVEYCLLYTSPSPRDRTRSRMPSSA